MINLPSSLNTFPLPYLHPPPPSTSTLLQPFFNLLQPWFHPSPTMLQPYPQPCSNPSPIPLTLPQPCSNLNPTLLQPAPTLVPPFSDHAPTLTQPWFQPCSNLNPTFLQPAPTLVPPFSAHTPTLTLPQPCSNLNPTLVPTLLQPWFHPSPALPQPPPALPVFSRPHQTPHHHPPPATVSNQPGMDGTPSPPDSSHLNQTTYINFRLLYVNSLNTLSFKTITVLLIFYLLGIAWTLSPPSPLSNSTNSAPRSPPTAT